MSAEPYSRRTAGLATFAAVIFAVSVVAIAALDRAGAPDGLVRALGPVVALIGLAAFGVGARTARLSLFIAVGRGAPPAAAGFSVAAVIAGFALGLGLRSAPPDDPLWPGAIAGAGLGAAALGPLIRRFGAAALSDIVATRFHGLLIRGAAGAAFAAAGALVAFAGYRAAVAVAEALITTDRIWAETIVGAALLTSVAAGGLASLVWCAAAAGGGAALIALAAWVFPATFGVAASAPASGAFALGLGSPEAVGVFVAAAIGAAGLIGLAPPTSGCRSTAAAAKAGLGGVLLFAAALALAISGTPVFMIEAGLATAGPVAASLAGAATLAASLALAGLGAFGASRALGVALARPPRPFATLASVRLARMRAGQAVLVAALAVADHSAASDPASALILAMALMLAVAAPVAGLAAVERAGPAAAVATLLTTVGVVGLRLVARGAWPAPTALLTDALAAAAAAFLVGALTASIAPRRGPAPTPGAYDPFGPPSG